MRNLAMLLILFAVSLFAAGCGRQSAPNTTADNSDVNAEATSIGDGESSAIHAVEPTKNEIDGETDDSTGSGGDSALDESSLNDSN